MHKYKRMDGKITVVCPNDSGGLTTDPSYAVRHNTKGTVVNVSGGTVTLTNNWYDFGNTANGDVVDFYDIPFNLKFNPQLSQEYNDLVALYDYIKLDGVKITWQCLQTTSNINTAASGQYSVMPSMKWVYDYDYFQSQTYLTESQLDATSDMREVVFQGGKKVSMFIRPKLSREVYQREANDPTTNTAVGVTIDRGNTWFDPQDTATSARQWNGIRGRLMNMACGKFGTVDKINTVVQCKIKYYFTGKKVV